MRRRRTRGATSVELTFAIVLIALLAVFGTMAFGNSLSRAYTSLARRIGLVGAAPDEDVAERSANPQLVHGGQGAVGGPGARNLRDLAKSAYDGNTRDWPALVAHAVGNDDRPPSPRAAAQVENALRDGDPLVIDLVVRTAITRDREHDAFERGQRRALELLTAAAGKLTPAQVAALTRLAHDTSAFVNVGDAAQWALDSDKKAKAAVLAALPRPASERARNGERWSTARRVALDELARQATLRPADWELLADVVAGESDAKVGLVIKLQDLSIYELRELPRADFERIAAVVSRDWRDLEAALGRARAAGLAFETDDERQAARRFYDEQRWYGGVKARLARGLGAGERDASGAVDAILDGADRSRTLALLAFLAEIPGSKLPASTRARVVKLSASADARLAEAAQQALDIPTLAARTKSGDAQATGVLVQLARALPAGELRDRVLQPLGLDGATFDKELARSAQLDAFIDEYAALVRAGQATPGRAGAYLVYFKTVVDGMAKAKGDAITLDYVGYLGLLHSGTLLKRLRETDLPAYEKALPGYLRFVEARWALFEKLVASDVFAPAGVKAEELPALRRRVLDRARQLKQGLVERYQVWVDDLDAYGERLDAMKNGDPPTRESDAVFKRQQAGDLDFVSNVRARLALVDKRLADPRFADQKTVYLGEKRSLELAIQEHELTLLEQSDDTTRKATIAALDADGRKALGDQVARVEAARKGKTGDRDLELYWIKKTLEQPARDRGVVAAEVDAAQERDRDARAQLRERLAYVQKLRQWTADGTLAKWRAAREAPADPGETSPLNYKGEGLVWTKPQSHWGNQEPFPDNWPSLNKFEAPGYWQMSDAELRAEAERLVRTFGPDVVRKMNQEAKDSTSGWTYQPRYASNPRINQVGRIKRNRAAQSYIFKILADPRRAPWKDATAEQRALWSLDDTQLAAREADLKKQLGLKDEAKATERKAAALTVETKLPGGLLLQIAEEELDALLEIEGARPARSDAVSLRDVAREVRHERELADVLPPALQNTPNPEGARAARLIKVIQELRPVFVQLEMLGKQYKGENADDVAARKAIAEIEVQLRETIATAWGADSTALQSRLVTLKRALSVLERAQVGILLRADGELEQALKKIEANAASAREQLKAINDAIKTKSHGRLAWPIVDIDPDKAKWDQNKRAYSSKTRVDAGPIRAQIAGLRTQYAGGQPVDLKAVQQLRQQTLLTASRQAMVDLHNQLLFFEVGLDKYPTAKSLSGSDTSLVHERGVALAGLIDEFDKAGTPEKQSAVLQKYLQLVGDGAELDEILKKAAKDFGWTEFTVSLGRTTYIVVVATVASGGAAGLVEGGVAATGVSLTVGGVTFETGALAATAAFLTEVTTFTVVTRGLNQVGGLGNEKSFLVDLRDNFITFGALRIIGAGFQGVKQIPAVKSWLGPVPTLGQKALFVVAEKTTVAASLLTMAEVHFYLDKGRAMNGDERLKAYITTAVHMSAGELIGLAKQGPRRPELLERIAAADKSYQKEITEIAAERSRLQELGKQIKDGKLRPDELPAKVIEERELALRVADREAQLYARVLTEGKLTARGKDGEALEFAKQQVEAYGEAAAKLELELALLRLGGAHNANFKADGSDVIVYREGTLPILRAVIGGKKNATITDRGKGRFVVEFDAANGRNRFQLVPSERAPGVLDVIKPLEGSKPAEAADAPARAVLTPLDDVATANAAKVQPLDGNTVDLVVHASRDVEGNVVIFQGGRWVEVSPRDLANWVRKNANRIGWSDGKRLRLLVCDAGLTGLAQRIATDLKAPVVAADGTVRIHGDGTVEAPQSSWLEFGPRRGETAPEPTLLGPGEVRGGGDRGPVATLGEPMPRAQLKALAAESLAALGAKSKDSVDAIKRGEDTVEEAQIGDGLAAAAVDRQTELVIGAQGRWHTDPSETLLQTTADLQKALEATLGDPSRFAAGKALIPIDVVTHLVDARLLQAKKYVHGWAEATPNADGSWKVRVKLADDTTVTVRVSKKLVVASGIPKEFPAGAPDRWAAMAKQGKALLGDEVSDTANVARIKAAKHIVIVGAGGSAVSSANAILKLNPTCRITFIAPEIPGSARGAANGIGRSAAFRELVRDYKGQIEYVLVNDGTGKYEHLKGNRFVVKGNARDLVYDLDGGGQIGTDVGGRSIRGDLLVAGIGRNFEVLPPPLRTPEVQAAFDRGEIEGVALKDRQGHYLGWEGTLPSGQKFVVTGSASRVLPKKIKFSDADRAFVTKANAEDIVTAGGNANTEFSAAPTVLQADRFLKAQRGSVDADPPRTEPTLPWLRDGGKTPTGPPPGAADAGGTVDGTRRAELRLPDGAPALVLKGKSYSGHEWATVRAYLAKQLGVAYADLAVKMLKGGRSGALLFAVKLHGKDIGVFKIFEWNGGGANESDMLKMIADKGLKRFVVVGERGVVKVEGGNDKPRDAIFMERADGNSVESMAERGDMKALVDAVPRVARALAEFHAAFERDGAKMSAETKRKDVEYLVSKVEDAHAKGYLDAAARDALVEALQKRLLPAIEAADLPATVYHGDANLGNFLIDGSDGPVRVIDVGNMKWSLVDGKPSRSGAFDLGRFVEALQTQRGKLDDAQVQKLQQLFLEAYFKANPKLPRAQQEAVILTARIELEFAIIRSPKVDATARAAAVERVKALVDQAKRLPPPRLDSMRRAPVAEPKGDAKKADIPDSIVSFLAVEKDQIAGAHALDAKRKVSPDGKTLVTDHRHASASSAPSPQLLETVAAQLAAHPDGKLNVFIAACHGEGIARILAQRHPRLNVFAIDVKDELGGPVVDEAGQVRMTAWKDGGKEYRAFWETLQVFTSDGKTVRAQRVNPENWARAFYQEGMGIVTREGTFQSGKGKREAAVPARPGAAAPAPDSVRRALVAARRSVPSLPADVRVTLSDRVATDGAPVYTLATHRGRRIGTLELRPAGGVAPQLGALSPLVMPAQRLSLRIGDDGREHVGHFLPEPPGEDLKRLIEEAVRVGRERIDDAVRAFIRALGAVDGEARAPLSPSDKAVLVRLAAVQLDAAMVRADVDARAAERRRAALAVAADRFVRASIAATPALEDGLDRVHLDAGTRVTLVAAGGRPVAAGWQLGRALEELTQARGLTPAEQARLARAAQFEYARASLRDDSLVEPAVMMGRIDAAAAAVATARTRPAAQVAMARLDELLSLPGASARR